jgi:lysyl-tRNA synthetase, class II
VNLFRWIPGYESAIYDEGKEPMLLLFVAFLVAFALTRLYTRLARTRGWGSGSAGGVHVHHMVPGVILMTICGILAFSRFGEGSVVFDLLAIGFGVGTALVLDEFAMILHLRDVYWTEEGRTSIDALLMGLALAGLLLVGSSPFDIEASESEASGAAAFFATVAVNVFLAAITFLKKKPFLGIVAILIPLVGLVASIRLAKPGSPWARWFYDAKPGKARSTERRRRKLERSLDRFERGRLGRFERWFSDFVGGAPLGAPASSHVESEHDARNRTG